MKMMRWLFWLVHIFSNVSSLCGSIFSFQLEEEDEKHENLRCVVVSKSGQIIILATCIQSEKEKNPWPNTKRTNERKKERWWIFIINVICIIIACISYICLVIYFILFFLFFSFHFSILFLFPFFANSINSIPVSLLLRLSLAILSHSACSLFAHIIWHCRFCRTSVSNVHINTHNFSVSPFTIRKPNLNEFSVFFLYLLAGFSLGRQLELNKSG